MVEILAILGIIAGLLLSSYIVVPPFFQRARDAERKADFDRVGKALEEYYDTNGCFPDTLPTCRSEFSFDGQTYLELMPCDPDNNSEYLYISPGDACNGWYQMYTNLERTEDPSIVRIRCDEGCGPDCVYNYGISSTNMPLDTCKPPPKLYACSPSTSCLEFADPQLSECPIVFPDDPTCQNACDIKENRCHDESGKKIPGK